MSNKKNIFHIVLAILVFAYYGYLEYVYGTSFGGIFGYCAFLIISEMRAIVRSKKVDIQQSYQTKQKLREQTKGDVVFTILVAVSFIPLHMKWIKEASPVLVFVPIEVYCIYQLVIGVRKLKKFPKADTQEPH